jgi:DNA-binding Xre family transcriptional regulator
MIRLIVREVAEREGISSPRELERAAGISYATAHALWNGTPRMVQLETIELLCTSLGVRPGQLFEFEPNQSKLARLLDSKQEQKSSRETPSSKRKRNK